mgnify:CR=1 FL=1
MEQRLTLVTLGVGDLGRSRRFYAALGWHEIEPRQDGVAFFQLNGIGLSLFPRAELAKDAEVADGAAERLEAVDEPEGCTNDGMTGDGEVAEEVHGVSFQERGWSREEAAVCGSWTKATMSLAWCS